MEVIQSNLIDLVHGPVSAGNGGISKGNPAAGSGGDTSFEPLDPIRTADKAGAAIATILVLVFVLGGAWYVDEPIIFLLIDLFDDFILSLFDWLEILLDLLGFARELHVLF